MNSISALVLSEAKMPEAVCESRPTKCRTRGMRDATRKAILQADPWLRDQLRQVEGQQPETPQRIAEVTQPAIALQLRSENHCE